MNQLKRRTDNLNLPINSHWCYSGYKIKETQRIGRPAVNTGDGHSLLDVCIY